jgi:hypothetical protein
MVVTASRVFLWRRRADVKVLVLTARSHPKSMYLDSSVIVGLRLKGGLAPNRQDASVGDSFGRDSALYLSQHHRRTNEANRAIKHCSRCVSLLP